VTRPSALKAFLAGGSVYLFPINANTASPWFAGGFPLSYEARKEFFVDRIGAKNDFNSCINSFMYYNCNAELGKTVKFFVKREEARA
jgi:hypothetical protein